MYCPVSHPHLWFTVSGEQGGGQVPIQDPHVILFQSAPARKQQQPRFQPESYEQAAKTQQCEQAWRWEACCNALLIIFPSKIKIKKKKKGRNI